MGLYALVLVLLGALEKVARNFFVFLLGLLA